MQRTLTRSSRKSSGAEPASPYLFLSIRSDNPAFPGARLSLRGVHRVMLCRGDATAIERRNEQGESVLHVQVDDGRMSATHARIQKILGTWVLADLESKNGTFVNGERTASAELSEGAVIEAGHSFFLFRESLPEADPAVLVPDGAQDGDAGLNTLSPALATSFNALRAVAAQRIPVLLRGESGTGKEVVARAVHSISRRAGAFVAVNCGALAPGLVQSELFGSTKGSFSGATADRPGFVRSSDHGTLLLDEIGDLPLPDQAALLRVLQEDEVVPVGAARPVKVDLRVVAATHRDLDRLAKEEKFRSDLLARLSGFTLSLPPLRDRREDLALIVAALLARHAPAQVTLTADAASALLRHSWPLNVRELEHCLSRAVALSRGGRIGLDHLPPELAAAGASRPQSVPEKPLGEKDARLRQQLLDLLRETGGNISAVARSMGKARNQVQRWIRRYALDPRRFQR